MLRDLVEFFLYNFVYRFLSKEARAEVDQHNRELAQIQDSSTMTMAIQTMQARSAEFHRLQNYRNQVRRAEEAVALRERELAARRRAAELV